MEETSRRSILGRHQSCYWEKIDILSDSIEGNYPSRNTSSLLYSKSCQIEDWRSLIWKSIHVASTTTKDLATSRLDKRIRRNSIGLYSWSTARRRSCSTVTRRSCQTSQLLPTNQSQSQSVIDQGNLTERKTWSVSKQVHLKKTRMSELNKLMIDQGNLINTPLQYKMTLKYIMRPKRSTPTMRHFVKELRET